MYILFILTYVFCWFLYFVHDHLGVATLQDLLGFLPAPACRPPSNILRLSQCFHKCVCVCEHWLTGICILVLTNGTPRVTSDYNFLVWKISTTQSSSRPVTLSLMSVFVYAVNVISVERGLLYVYNNHTSFTVKSKFELGFRDRDSDWTIQYSVQYIYTSVTGHFKNNISLVTVKFHWLILAFLVQI